MAEYYRIPYEAGIENKSFAFYDESKDAWQKLTWAQLFAMSSIGKLDEEHNEEDEDYEDGEQQRVDNGSGPRNYQAVTTRYVQFTETLFIESLYEMEPKALHANNMTLFLIFLWSRLPNHAAANNLIVDWQIPRQLWNGMQLEDDINPFVRLYQAVAGNLRNPLYQNPTADDMAEFLSSIAYEIEPDMVGLIQTACERHNRRPNVEKQSISGAVAHVMFNYGNPLNFNLPADIHQPGDFVLQCRDKFLVYLRKFLLGRSREMPYGASRLLSLLNWQGIAPPQDGAPNGQLLDAAARIQNLQNIFGQFLQNFNVAGNITPLTPDRWELVVIRPNIEHNMLGIVMGRGGLEVLPPSPCFYFSCFRFSECDKHVNRSLGLPSGARRSSHVMTTPCTASGVCRTSTMRRPL